MLAVSLEGHDLWMRVRHREFDPLRLYRALAFVDYQQSGHAYFLLVSHKGYPWFVRQNLCVAAGENFFTDPLPEQKLPPWPAEKPRADIDVEGMG